ncbi:hypothetical protein PYCCODRAFT_1479173 [Trametes coccinea BRFM310]|uniref:FHA domain-containing protein n=1 Tax=Trametes coccinea (strain BRFM310) TaxID=1353009 RepID=A0A1Y2IH54_TRAC3|nr:hypothetical protein PYCCODRAFT_1479173 [Trametes coccinea BRFM310]
MDPSDIGRFGTLSLLRRLPVESVVTSYPIDDEELTIGRDQSCSLRLYYPAVSALHAKITFVERKAFLVVLGTNGLLLDDAPLFPAPATAPGPTTVPLQNNSVIEIHKKRFRFSYPPKHLRPALINTPSRATPMPSRRPLRLSMIASAHVFTPGPSPNPQENLRVLQSPLRTPFAREDEEEIVLVHSNTPRVVEEDKDLVILDEVEPEPVLPLPLPVAHQAPKTPVRRQNRQSLHRAVLLRSAQRVHIQREMQMEEEQEAEEVEETIAAIAEADEGDDDVQEIPPPDEQTRTQVTGWRKSIDMVKGSLGWAFRGLSVEPKEEEEETSLEQAEEQQEDYDEEDDNDMDEQAEEHEYEDEFNENYDEQPTDQLVDHEEEPEPPRPLGRFMTPQIQRTTSAVRAPRMSLGAGPHAGPQRVRLVAPWKVSEIQVPASVKEEQNSSSSGSVSSKDAMPLPSTPSSAAKRERLTEEEREAIRARRRSALATPDNFFNGQVPGSRRKLFPSLAPLPSPNFSATSHSSAPAPAAPQQPTAVKEESPPTAVKAEVKGEDEDEDAKEDTAVLLARMRQMVEGVKQRQSLGRQSLNVSPRKRDSGFSLLAPGHAIAHAASRILVEEDDRGEEEEDVEMREHDQVADEDGDEDDDRRERAQPRTPRMSDLRHIFGRAHAEPSTPALAGVRDMFRAQPRAAPETPPLEGVGEMMGTPAGYRRQVSPERRARRIEVYVGQEEDDQVVQEAPEEEQRVPEPDPEPAPARETRGKKPPSKIARRATVSVATSSKAPEDSGESGDEPRRTRAHTADGAVGHQVSRAAPRRKAKVAEVKPSTPEPDAPRPTRRTRQTTAEPPAADAAETKPARKTTRAKTPTAKSAATRRGTRAKPIEVEVAEDDDGEDDPLDSLSRDDGEAEHAEETAAPEPKATTTRARRGTRSKIPTVTAVKQEDVEPALPAAENDTTTTTTRTTRARRTPVPRQPTPSGGAGAGANTTGRAGSRTRGASVVAAAAPHVEPAIPEDKENTPERDSGAGDDHDEETEEKAPAPRRTAGKTRRVAKAAVVEEETEEEKAGPVRAPAAKTRRTRAARS